MPTVSLKALTLPATPDGYQYYDMIEYTPGSPPPRPHPTPPDPNAPHPEHPIVPPGGYPEGPGFGLKPSHPIALPGDPWFPEPYPPKPGDQPKGTLAVVMKAPEGAAATPPADLQLTPVMIDLGKGTKPAQAWMGPYVSTGPV